MKLFVSPDVMLRIATMGKDGIPPGLKAWSDEHVRDQPPSVPVIIDYEADPGFWRLVDDEDTTLASSASTEENKVDHDGSS